jgi:Protein of unknown function (DUF1552)
MQRKIGRRGLLGGAAVTLALPFLPSLDRPMGGVRLAQAAPTAPKRFLVYFIPNGVYAKDWTPANAGPNFTLSPTLMPIAPVRNDILVVSGITNTPGEPPTTGGAHANGQAAVLTCRQYMKDNKVNLGKSVDQMIASQIMSTNPTLKLPSLELGIKDQLGLDGPAIFGQNISWHDPMTPAPPIEKPSVAFDRLFTGFDPSASAGDAAKRKVYRISVLDVVQKDAARLSGRLGTGDKARLEQFLTSVRDTETRIQTDPALGASCMVPAKQMDPTDFPTQVDINHQLMALAFQCDITRVISFMHGYALGGRSFPFIGVNDNGHSVTHHSGDPTLIAKEKTIDTWRVGIFVKFLQMLAGITDVDGNTVLHNSLIYYTSEIDDGNGHSQDNKPILLAGQLGGAIKTGQNLEFPAGAMGKFLPCNEFAKTGCMNPQLGDLYVTIMNQFGIPVAPFGDSGKMLLTGLT